MTTSFLFNIYAEVAVKCHRCDKPVKDTEKEMKVNTLFVQDVCKDRKDDLQDKLRVL